MKKMTASHLLIKAFLKYKKYWLYIVLTAFVAAFVSCGFWIFMNVSETLETDTNKLIYGSYNLKISNLHGDMPFFLSRESGIEKAVPYTEQQIEKDGEKFNVINADEMYLELSNVSMLNGTYPVEKNEVLVDKTYLERIGVQEENMIGSTLEFGEQRYIVTGVTETNEEYEMINPAVTVIGSKISYQNAVLIKTSVDSAESFITYLESVYRYRLWDAEYFINTESDIVQDSNEGETDYASIFILFIVISLSSVVTITNCIKVLLLNAGKDIGIFRAIGVGNKYIFAAIRKIGVAAIAFANILVVLCSGIMKQLFTMLVAGLKGMSVAGGEAVSAGSMSWLTIIMIATAFVVVEVIALFIQTGFMSRKSTLSQLKNSRGLNFKNKLSNTYHKVGKNIILTMSLRNYKMTWKTNLFISISLVLCMTLLSSMSYYLRLIESAEIDYGQADYRVEFLDDFSIGDDMRIQRDAFIANIEESAEGCTVNPIYGYVSSQRVAKTALSEAFVNYINKNAKYARLMDNKIQKTFPVNVVVAGYSEKNLRRVLQAQGINPNDVNMPKDNECIVCAEALGLGEDEKILNDNLPTVFDLAGKDGKETSLNISGIIPRVPDDYISEEVGILAIVSLETFREISGTNIPSMVMYSVPSGNDALINAVFDGKEFVTIENLNKENRQLQKNRQTLQILSVIVFVIIALASFVNFLTTFMIKIKMFGREYGVLNAIGVSMKKIMRVILYEMGLIVLPVIVVSALLTVVITFVLNSTIQLQMYSDYLIPYDLIGITSVFIVVAVLTCLVFVARRMMSLSAVNQIKKMN